MDIYSADRVMKYFWEMICICMITLLMGSVFVIPVFSQQKKQISGNSTERNTEEKMVEVKINDSSGRVLKDGFHVRPPTEVNVRQGEDIFVTIQGRVVTYRFRNNETLTFEVKKNQIFVNGDPIGLIVSSPKKEIPEKLGGHPVTNLSFDKMPTSSQWREILALPTLLGLDLNGTGVMNDDLKPMKKMTSLRMVALGGTEITDDGLVHFNDLTSLRKLVLVNTQITDKGLKHLTNLTSLRSLDLGYTDITNKGLKQLKSLTSLRSINLKKTKITNEGLKYLKELAPLRGLDLGWTKLSDEGLKQISGMDYLHSLGLSGTRITNQGLKHLKDLTSLRMLKLQSTKVTDDGIKHLKNIRSLRKLILFRSEVTDQGADELKEALPNCEIIV